MKQLIAVTVILLLLCVSQCTGESQPATNTLSGVVPMRSVRATPIEQRAIEKPAAIAQSNMIWTNGVPFENAPPELGTTSQEFQLAEFGSQATWGRHEAFFNADIASEQPIQVTMPDGKNVAFRPTFIVLANRVTGQQLLIAEITNQIAQIIQPDRVIWTNAFDKSGPEIDVEYHYTASGVEQNIVFRENPLKNLPSEWKLADIAIECWTEAFFDSVPSSIESKTTQLRAESAAEKALHAEDQDISWDSMKIVAGGRAFSVGPISKRARPGDTAEIDHEQDSLPVSKIWTEVDDRGRKRTFIIETLDAIGAKPKLDALKEGRHASATRPASGRSEFLRLHASSPQLRRDARQASSFPSDKQTLPASERRQMMVSLKEYSAKPGFVLDFAIVNTLAVPPGIISWWPAGGNALDAITSHNDGFLSNGVTYASGKVGQGFSFGAYSNYVKVPNSASLNPTNALTIDCWVYLEKYGSNNLLVAKDNQVNLRQYALTLSPEKTFRACVGITNGTFYYIDSATLATTGVWTHVAMTYSAANSSLSLYVNGHLDTNAAVVGSAISTTEPVFIGNAPRGWPYWWSYDPPGRVDEVDIFNRALSASEIQSIYDAGAAGKYNPNCITPSTNVVAWWPAETNSYDIAGTNFAYPFNGPSYAAGAVRSAFSFDGTNDYFVASNAPALNLTNALTLESWVYLNSWSSNLYQGNYPIISKDGCTFNRQYLLTVSGNQKFRAHIGTVNSTCSQQFCYGDGRTTVQPGGWYHVAMTYDTATSKLILYVNGAEDLTLTNILGPIISTSEPVFIGGTPHSCFPCYFPGLIDEPTIYNRALTATEISAIYSAGSAGKCACYITNQTYSCVSPASVSFGSLLLTHSDICAVSNHVSASAGLLTNPGIIRTTRQYSDCNTDYADASFSPTVVTNWYELTAPDGSFVDGGNALSASATLTIAGVYTLTFCATYTNTFPCTNGGTISVSTNLTVEGGPYYGDRECSQLGAVVNPGTLSATNIAVCVGDTISRPTVSGFTLTDGLATRWVTFDCPDRAPYLETNIVPFVPILIFDPPIPDRILTPGTYTFTPYLAPFGDFICAEQTNFDDVTITVQACTNIATTLLNIDFNDGSLSEKVGPSAVGQFMNDFWNGIGPTNDFWSTNFSGYPELRAADGSTSPIRMVVNNLPYVARNNSPDSMLDDYVYPDPTNHATLIFTNVPVGIWDLYLFSHSGAFYLNVGTNIYGPQTNPPVPAPPYTPPLASHQIPPCVHFSNVQVRRGQSMVVTLYPGTNGTSAISGLQLASVWSAAVDTDGDGISDLNEHQLGLDPMDVASKNTLYASWNFENVDWIGDQGQVPLNTSGLNNTSLIHGLNGHGADLNGTNQSKSLNYRCAEPDTRPNISYNVGTVRLWFKPSWSSSGGGPPNLTSGQTAHLLTIGNDIIQSQWGVWEIFLDSTGTQIGFKYLLPQGGGLSPVMRTIPGGLIANQWHQFAVTYSATATTLYCDGQQLGSAGGAITATWALGVSAIANGIFIASDKFGNQRASGTFDALETFDYAKDAATILSEYNTAWYGADTDWDGLPDGWERVNFGDLDQDGNGDPDGDGLSNRQEWLAGKDPITVDAPAVAFPAQSQTVFAGSNVTFTIVPTGTVLGSYTFQWKFNSQDIVGATDQTLRVNHAQFTNSGVYSAKISNAAGTMTSPLARLTVWTPGKVAAWGRDNYGQLEYPNERADAVAIAAGTSHTVVLRSDGVPRVWGFGYYGEALMPGTATNVATVAAGSWRTLALRNDGTVVEWGLGSGVPTDLTGVVAIAAGYDHSLALKSDGKVVAWGDNSAQQSTVPAGLENVVAIAAGDYHSLALKDDGTVVTWGEPGNTSLAVPAGLHAIAICAGYHMSAAVRTDGKVVVWGNTTSGELIVPDSANKVFSIASGHYPDLDHILALKQDASVVAWGHDDYGQADVPSDLGGAVAVSASRYHSLAIYVLNFDNDGLDDAWERQYFGNLDQEGDGDYDGDGLSNLEEFLHGTDPTVADAPLIAVPPQSQTVLRGNDVTFTVVPVGSLTTGYTYQWCFNGRDIVGTTDATLTLNSVQFTNSGVYHVRVGNGAGSVTSPLARLTVWTPGTVKAWGNNDIGQTNVPNNLTNVVSVSAGSSNSLALLIDGTVLPWGDISHGATPPPGDATNIVAISCGAWHCMALRNDGNVLVWGRNNEGQTNVPSSINGSVVAISAGSNHCLVLLTDGSTVAWGANNAGQGVSSPGNGFVAIAAGGLHNIALKADGTVVGWGSGIDGRTTTPPGLNNVIRIFAGQDYSAALESAGSVHVWGNNSYQQKTIPLDASQSLLLSSGPTAQHIMAIQNNLGVVPWGRNLERQTNVPYRLDDAVCVSGGQAHSLALVMADWDGDGLPGWWERENFVDLHENGNDDDDGDGLSNMDEFLRNSDPITADPPAIAVPPQSQTVFGGSDVTFSVVPTGSTAGSYSYQWQVNGRNIAGATGRTLNFSSVHFTNAGNYSVLVSASGGVIRSTLARLTVWTPGAVRAWGRNNDNQTNVPLNLTNVVGVSGGNSQTFALKSDGTVVGWTVNHFQELSIPSTLNSVAVVSAGGWHTMALKDDGTVVVWGDNYYGQWNVPSGVNGNAVAIAAGHNHCLALKKDGTVAAWGDNSNGQTNVPVNLANVVAIAAGTVHSLALKSDGTVVGWGASDPQHNRGQQTPPNDLANVVSLCAGHHHSAAIKADGSVRVWGDNGYGQWNYPAAANNLVMLASGSSGCDHLLAIRKDLKVIPWGRDNYKQTDVPADLDDVAGIGAGQDHSVVIYIPNTLGIASPPLSQTVFAGNNATFSVCATGAVVNPFGYQWQYNGRTIAGATDATLIIPNVQFTNSGVVNVIVTNGTHSVTSVLARLTVWTPGAPRAWGDNTYGEGVEPPGLTNVVSISSGNGYNSVLMIDGTVYPWGDNSFSKTAVPNSATNIAVLAGGSQHTLGLRNDGTVVAWGWNSGGSTIVPTDLREVVAVAGGYYFSMALQNDRTIRVWGDTSQGEANIPSAVNGRAVAIAAGQYHCLALRDDGLVFTWGSFDQSTVPTDLGQVVGIAGLVNGCAALKADGTVRVWGGGSSTPPPSATSIIQLSSSSDASHYLAIRKDLSVITWGANGSGQINQPSQLGDVTAVAAGQTHSLALYVSDWDGDGMAGWWERQYFGNLDRDGNGDYDGDGVSDLQEFLKQSNPTTYSQTRLASWRFNRSDCVGDQGQIPLTCAGLSSALVPGLEGGAIDMNDYQGQAMKVLSYRCVEANSQANINLTSGTVRFWFKPSWSSVSHSGYGPGSAGRLINIGEYSSPPTIGCWQLVLASSGDAIKFAVSDNSGNPSHLIETSYLTIPGGMVMNQWYQIAVTYTPTSRAIYVNGTALTPAPSGGLNSIVPPQSIRDLGFFIGSDTLGSQKSFGTFEFLETFNYAKTATQIANEYTDSDGDGINNSQDGDFTDPTKGTLNITIDKPLNGSTINR